MHKVLKKLEDAKLLVELEKSFFYTKKVNFLGYIVTLKEVRI